MKQLAVLTTILFFTLFVGHVFAQTEAESSKQQYLRLVTQYREKDRQYLVAYQQYLQLLTLASQEEMVKQAKDAMNLRAQTLDTYLLAVSQALAQTKGVELSRQQTALKDIDTQRTVIQAHKDQVESLTDRVALDTESMSFQKLQPSIENAAYSALALIKIAQLQNSIDQLQSPIDMITQSLEGSSLEQTVIEEKKRGLTEIGRQLELVKQSLVQAQEDYDSSAKTQKFDADDYTSITSILSSGYAKTKLILSYVQELSK